VDSEGKLDKYGATIRASDWHTDGSFRKNPYSYTILYSLEAPKKGGNTDFNNMVDAYQDLEDDLKNEIANYTAFHKRGQGWLAEHSPPPLSKEQKASGFFEGNSHPIVIKNPISKKKTLYINPTHTEKINELDKLESDAVLNKLMKSSIKEKYQYSHQWQKNDLVIWDQRDLLHRASQQKVIDEKRIMIRSMVINKPHRIP
ncbi:MAG: TauD/TfdA family dioxygenase, partial [SAR324 cluster bacterium]|nr:TauD/TfdA family dioxygenase [SAR324 cluster bacterium]